MKQRILPTIACALLLGGAAQAQLSEEFNAPPSNCCLPGSARMLADQLLDWNQLGRYHKANAALAQQPPEPKRVIFMGDSITDFWKLDESFPGKPYVDRGISGQTTPQMVVRMYPDVIDLKPAAMVVLAGVNDISHNTGPETATMIEENIMAMTDLAQRHGIKVILCSVLPVSDYPFLAQAANPQPAASAFPGRGPMRRMKMTEGHPPADILKINAWMKEYASSVKAAYVDYFAAMVDEKGWMKENLSADGLHPNAEGYKVMAPLVAAAIESALK